MSVTGGTQGYVSGQIIPVSEGACCDNHPDSPATKRVVGEVDQFGYEASDFCDLCFTGYTQMNAMKGVVCDHCGCHATHLRPVISQDKDTGVIIADKVCNVCVSKMVHDAVNRVDNDEDPIDDYGIEIPEEEENDDYRYKSNGDDDVVRPLNFNSSRW